MPPINLYELGFDKVYIKIINSSDGKSPSLPGIAAQKSVGQSTVLCRGTHSMFAN